MYKYQKLSYIIKYVTTDQIDMDYGVLFFFVLEHSLLLVLKSTVIYQEITELIQIGIEAFVLNSIQKSKNFS